jgi:predicted O-methyltransferase YrrM
MKKFTLFLSVCISVFGLRPVPWLTEEAIVFLEVFLEENKNARILEFGSGASTVWFAKRTNNLVSIEHHPEWYRKISDVIESEKECNSIIYKLKSRPYDHVCDQFEDNYFDLILIDGRERRRCILKAASKVKPGGILMVDNSERRHYHSAYLLMDGWESFITHQPEKDSCGFTYSGWETRWWVKPKQT